ncbi:MAG TPA: hypothetical protein VHX37_07035 [Acidobacteriaceae bacterium]|jgi:hypothetical protein|nr:hypothetical protein [Acidobacteriaceae bacterium]
MPSLMTDPLRRPPIVTTMAIISCMAGGMALITGLSLAFPGTVFDRIWRLNPRAYAAFARMGRVSGVLLLVLCPIAAATAAGLLRRRRWAWWLALVTFGLNGLGDVASVAVTHDWLKASSGVLIAAVFLSLLLRADTRSFFTQRT